MSLVNVYTCKNGVRIVEERMMNTRAVAIGIWVRAGSRYETPAENGITHFIEHMLFKGTTTRSAKAIAETFDIIGGDLNAFTARDNTCYHATVLDEHAQLAIEVLADMFFNSTFDSEAIEREKQVIYEEIAMDEDTPDEFMADHFWRALFPNQALGAPILGTKETLATFNQQMIKAYMAAHYLPENIVISIAGNSNAELIALIEQKFGVFEATATIAESTLPVMATTNITLTKEVEQAQLMIAYPSLTRSAKNSACLTVVDTIIGGITSSRLFQKVREERGLAYTIYSYPTTYYDTGVWTVYCATQPHQLEQVQQVIEQVLADIATHGVTDEEVTRAKMHLQGSFVLNLESAEAHMQRNGEIFLNHLTHYDVDEVLLRLKRITTAEINEVAQAMLQHTPSIARMIKEA